MSHGPTRRWSALATTVVVACALAAGCGGDGSGEGGGDSDSPPGANDRSGEPITYAGLHECNVPKAFRCGSIDVPLEREDPSLGKTRIHFAWHRRRNLDKPALAPIFALEGGPGYPSTRTGRTYRKLFGPLLDRRDLVLVDGRGTGGSDALECGRVQEGVGPELITVGECGRRMGQTSSSYRTEASANDIDDVRRALGIDRIQLYGDSYGSYLAQSYAFRYSDALDAVVLDSTYPVTNDESPFFPTLLHTALRSLQITCDRSPHCSGDAIARLAKVTRMKRDAGGNVGALIDATDGGHDPPGPYLHFNRAVSAYLNGDPRELRELTAPYRLSSGRLRNYSRMQEIAVECSDYRFPWDKEASEPERRAQLERAIRRQPPEPYEPFTPREWALGSSSLYLFCLTWPKPTKFYEPPVPPDAKAPDVPVLVIAGELDNVTSPKEGRQTAQMFPDSRYAEFRNSGHVQSLYDKDPPQAVRIRHFLRNHDGR